METETTNHQQEQPQPVPVAQPPQAPATQQPQPPSQPLHRDLAPIFNIGNMDPTLKPRWYQTGQVQAAFVTGIVSLVINLINKLM